MKKSITHGINEAKKRFDPKIVNAVVRRIGRESIHDVVDHGIDGGFGGFIYYTDTVRRSLASVKFYNTYKKIILNMAEDLASDMGEDMITMVQGFN